MVEKIEVSADGEILQYFVQTTISRWFITSLDHEVRFATQSQTCHQEDVLQVAVGTQAGAHPKSKMICIDMPVRDHKHITVIL